MEGNNGCLNWAGFIAFVVALYIWVNNVETVKVVEQIPPPQDSWDIVYPKFRDDVSAQLLNTQKIAGSVLDETAYLRAQNADLQNSVDLLLSNLGILKKESYEESIRQRNEQRITTVLSVFFGWFLGAFVTKDSMREIRQRFSQRKKKGTANHQNPKAKEEDNIIDNSLGGHFRKEQSARSQPASETVIHRLPQAVQLPKTKLCPKCGVEMAIQISPVGELKGKQFFVCPNFKKCKQVLPVS